LEPQHLSWYHLTLEPNTVFHARPPDGMPDQEKSAEIQDQGQALLANLAYEQYEVSAYARGRNRCEHNLNYWSFGDYLAVGAGAHGKISDNAGIWRYTKPANPKQYLETIETGAQVSDAHRLAPPDLLFEFMLNVLRLNEGFTGQQFTARTGLPIETLLGRLETPSGKGLIELSAGDCWQVTPLGRRFLNDLQADFLPE